MSDFTFNLIVASLCGVNAGAAGWLVQRAEAGWRRMRNAIAFGLCAFGVFLLAWAAVSLIGD